MSIDIVRVKIGEIKVGKGDKLLKATLGSCVGISFYDTVHKQCALAHCLLPRTEDGFSIGAKYVNQAFASLMSLMRVKDRNQHEFIVSYAGGANMMKQIHVSRSYEIGQRNLEALKDILKGFKFRVKELDTGCRFGRQMSINCKTGEVEVLRLLE